MKASFLFVVVGLIHLLGIGGFVLMQGCVSRTAPTVAPAPPPPLPPKANQPRAVAPRPVVKPFALPPIKTPSTPAVGTVDHSEAKTYTVKKGDSLSKIAYRNSVSTKELAAFNNLTNLDAIRIGQKLYLPLHAKARSGATKATSKPAKTVKKASGGSYVVRAGDSLSKIAANHGIRTADLKAANSLTSDRILVGQTLALPGGSKKAAAPSVAKSPSKPKAPAAEKSAPKMEMIKIAPVSAASMQKPKEQVEEKVEEPVVPEVSAPSTSEPVDDGTFPYTVQDGETLKDISKAFIVSLEDILKVNNLTHESQIQPGMKIKIPPSEY